MNTTEEEFYWNFTIQNSILNPLLEFTKDGLFYWLLYNTILALYFMVSLSIYEFRSRKAKPVIFCRHRRFTSAGFNALPRILCWSSSIALFWYWIHRLVISKLLFGSQSDYCTLDYQLRNASVCTARLLLISVLWCRQRSFYENEVIRRLSNKLTRMLSILVGVVAAMINGGALLIFVFAVELQKGNEKCDFAVGFRLQQSVFQYLRFFLIAIHIGLTGLFVMPLVKHTLQFAKLNRKAGERSNAHVQELIIRSLAVSVVYVVMDFLPFFIPLFENRELGIAVFAHTSLTIPFVLTIFIFVDWKERLFPWRKMSNTEQKSGSEKHEKHNINSVMPTGVTPSTESTN